MAKAKSAPKTASSKTTKSTAKAKSTSKRAAQAEPALVDLTPEEIKRLPRPREGFERFVEPLISLYQEHGDELAVPGVEAATVLGTFTTYQALGPVEDAAKKHLEMVQETRLLNASRAWSALMEVYVKAKAVARNNVEVRRAIADFQKFMSTGPRAKKTDKKA